MGTPEHNTRLSPLKRKALKEGVPYTSARDAHFRGELPIVKFGAGTRQRWYVEHRDWEAWIESRKERA